MKKEVVKFTMNSSAKSRQGILGIILTLLVISILIFSAPAKAVTVNLPAFADPVPENLPYDFQVSVDIAGGEIVPVQTLELSIGAETCIFDVLGTPQGGDCDSFNINRNMSGEDDCSEAVENLYGYGYGSADGNIPYDYAGTNFGYGYAGQVGDCSLTYDITWDAADVAADTELPITLKAYATNGGTDYYYVSSSSLTIENVPPAVISAGVTDADFFYSSFAGNDVVNVVVETSTSVTGVTADFGALGAIDCGSGSDTISLTETGDDVWTGACDVGDEAATADFESGGVVITATDGISFDPGGFGIVLYSMTTLQDSGCFSFGELSTDFSEQLNFSDINFVVDMEIDFSCLLGELLPEEHPAWMEGPERVLLLDFSSVDMSSPESAALIADFGSYIDIDINLPGEFGDSRIFVDSEYLSELDTAAEITIYHLPFTSAPTIAPDDDAEDPMTVTWTQGTGDEIGEGTLSFSVAGFSGYDITDNTAPSISIISPNTVAQRSDVVIDVSVDGTDTAISDLQIDVLNSGDVAVYSFDETDCEAEDASNEVYRCTFTIASANLPIGDYTLSVDATDYGGAAGNNAVEEYAFQRLPPLSTGGGGGGTSWSGTFVVDDIEELGEDGYTRQLAVRQRIKALIGGDYHYIGILSIVGNLVTIEVRSTPQTVSLNIGESQRLDLDADGYYDLLLKHNGIISNKVDLTIANIHEPVLAATELPSDEPITEPEAQPETTPSTPCTPDWSCREWSECVSESRARLCTDKNNCGTLEGKPAESEACITAKKSLPFISILLGVLIVIVIGIAVMFYLQKRNDNDF